jgi:hypothetical protein
MTSEARVAPLNSLLLVMDRQAGAIPDSMSGQAVAATPSCIAVGTQTAADGETHVILTDESGRVEADTGLVLVYHGALELPSREVCVLTVSLEPVLSMRVKDRRMSVAVWTNDRVEPSRVRIAVCP